MILFPSCPSPSSIASSALHQMDIRLICDLIRNEPSLRPPPPSNINWAHIRVKAKGTQPAVWWCCAAFLGCNSINYHFFSSARQDKLIIFETNYAQIMYVGVYADVGECCRSSCEWWWWWCDDEQQFSQEKKYFKWFWWWKFKIKMKERKNVCLMLSRKKKSRITRRRRCNKIDLWLLLIIIDI